jgi:hypothetical protein
MQADPRFASEPKHFWAHVRSISQHVGYTEPEEGYLPVPAGLTIPKNFKKHGEPRKTRVLAITFSQVRAALCELGLSDKHLVRRDGSPNRDGQLLCDYFEHRAKVLNEQAQHNLMNAGEAQTVFRRCAKKHGAAGPFVMNKQSGPKKAEAFLTCIAKMIVENGCRGFDCDFDPQELTTITRENRPYRTLARRVDGAFPSPVNPIAIWEIKEYYYTTTFGSRIADGIYESLLDGLELEEFGEEGTKVRHYLMVNAHFAFWGMGKPYLCRIVDMLHMGYVDEVLFGKEVVDRLPSLVDEWVREAARRKSEAGN